MSAVLPYRRAAGDDDLLRASRLVHLAFGTPVDACEQWLRGAGEEQLRVVGPPGAPATACLLRIPMGMWFGGERVPTLGLAGVAVAPEARGGGHARRMLTAFLEEARADGFAVSTLYPSSMALYRSVGWELGGTSFEYRLETQPLPAPRDEGLTTVPLAGVDDRVRACRDAFARLHAGALDRGPYCWGRVVWRRGVAYDGYGFADERGALEAYVFAAQQLGHAGPFDLSLRVSDLAFTTPRGARALVGFFRGYATMSKTAVFAGGPVHPLAFVLPEQRFAQEKIEHWMLRVTDVARALETRGYPAGVTARLAFELDDPVLPAQSGRWTLAVEGGHGRVTRGVVDRTPVLGLGPRGLAAIFSGAVPPRDAATVGLVAGAEPALALAGTVFAGPAPWTSDFY